MLHPALYRHMLPEAEAQFARMAVEVWGIDPKGRTREALANAFIDALSAFIREIGLPATLGGMGITGDIDLHAIADTTILTGGSCKRFTHDELYEILKESL